MKPSFKIPRWLPQLCPTYPWTSKLQRGKVMRTKTDFLLSWGENPPRRHPLTFSLCFIGQNWVNCWTNHCEGEGDHCDSWLTPMMFRALRLGTLPSGIEKGSISITYMNETCLISSHWRWLWWKTNVCSLSPLDRTKSRWVHYYSFSFSNFQVDLASHLLLSSPFFSPTSHQCWS